MAGAAVTVAAGCGAAGTAPLALAAGTGRDASCAAGAAGMLPDWAARAWTQKQGANRKQAQLIRVVPNKKSHESDVTPPPNMPRGRSVTKALAIAA